MKKVLLVLGAVVAVVIVLLRLRPASPVAPPAETTGKEKKNGTKGVGGGGSGGTIGGAGAGIGLPANNLDGTPAAPAVPATYQNTGILLSTLAEFSADAWASYEAEQQAKNSKITDREKRKFEKRQVKAYQNFGNEVRLRA